MNKTADIQTELIEQVVATVIAWRAYYRMRKELDLKSRVILLEAFITDLDELAIKARQADASKSGRTGESA